MPLRIQTILKSCSAAPMQRWENTSLCPLDKSPWDIQSAKNRNLTNKLKKKKKIRIQSLSRGTVINDLCYCSAFPPLRPSFQVYCKNWKKCFNAIHSCLKWPAVEHSLVYIIDINNRFTISKCSEAILLKCCLIWFFPFISFINADRNKCFKHIYCVSRWEWFNKWFVFKVKTSDSELFV